MPAQACELPVESARAAALPVAQRLMALAAAWQVPAAAAKPLTRRYWIREAATWCYHTVVGIPPERSDALVTAVDAFYRAASLPQQPWYADFQRGTVQPLAGTAEGVMRQQLSLSVVAVGLPKPRAYRQLVSRVAHPTAPMQAVVLRSVDASSLPWPADAVPAYTLDPTGDVVGFHDNTLFWHHFCTTPGASLLPMPQDRWLTNVLRALRLDVAERRTYREEARAWGRWARSGFRA